MNSNEYTKKPVTIEAFQMTDKRRWDNNEWPNWLNKAWNEGNENPNSVFSNPEDPNRLQIRTPEGVMDVHENWFIVNDGIGLWACDPTVFNDTYTIKQKDNAEIDPLIENNFRYHPPVDEAQKETYENIREAYKNLAYFLKTQVPGSRELSVAMTNLETSMFWANAGVARNSGE